MGSSEHALGHAVLTFNGAMRWAVSGGELTPGLVLGMPGPMNDLIAEHELVVWSEPRGLVVELMGDRSWSDWGERVADALEIAMGPGAWEIRPDPDAVLTAIARDVIEGTLSSYISSHGGAITLVGVHDGQVDVALEGACAHCSAAGQTLHGQIEKAIAARYPQVKRVRDVMGRAANSQGTPLTLRWPRLHRR